MSSIANAADSAREAFITPQAGARDVAHQARIAAIDVMRGLVMLFMLVDHMRETVYLHKRGIGRSDGYWHTGGTGTVLHSSIGPFVRAGVRVPHRAQVH